MPQSLPELFNIAFTTALVVGAMLAVARLIYAGAIYMTTDLPGAKGNAKGIIGETMTGLLLLLAVWLILAQINPQILNLNILRSVSAAGKTAGPVTPSAPAPTQPPPSTTKKTEPCVDSAVKKALTGDTCPPPAPVSPKTPTRPPSLPAGGSGQYINPQEIPTNAYCYTSTSGGAGGAGGYFCHSDASACRAGRSQASNVVGNDCLIYSSNPNLPGTQIPTPLPDTTPDDCVVSGNCPN